MQEILDQVLLETYLNQYNIRSLFDTPELPYRLYTYEPGEMMNILRPTTEYLKFVVAGSFDLYSVREDGVRNLIRHFEGFGFLGDLEFCGKNAGTRYQEVIDQVYTIELPLKSLRPVLMEDKRFLRFVLNNLAEKLSAAMPLKAEFPSLADTLVYYLRYECTDHRITSVEDTDFRLNYSRRQLQRVLRELTEQGVLLKEGKGRYKLLD